MSAGRHHACRATGIALAIAASVTVADLTSRFAYSDAVVSAQVDTAIREAVASMRSLDEPEAPRRQPRLHVSSHP